MNILTITSSFPLYDGHGAGPFVLEEARELADLGHQQTILSQLYKCSSPSEFIGPIEVCRFKWIQPKGYVRIREMTGLSHLPHLISYFVSATLYSLRLAGKRKIDVIYAQWALPSGLVGGIVSRIRRLPLVVVVHGADVLGKRPQKFPFRHVNRWVFQNADRILARGEYLYERINDIYGAEFRDKMVNIPMGLDVERFTRHTSDAKAVQETRTSMVANGRPIVLTIRNLSPNYELENLLTTIQVFKSISGNIKPLFVIIGGGTAQYKARLEKLVEQLDIGEDIRFLGPVEHREMAKYISACDIFIDPASIGQGVACLEAMSLAKPAIGFRRRGAAVKIEDGKGGFLVELSSPPETACREMAGRIKTLLENDELRRKLGDGALSTVRDSYDLRVTTKMIADLLEEVAQTQRLKKKKDGRLVEDLSR